MFEDWLVTVKGYSRKASHDVLSRQKRVLNILGTKHLDLETLPILERNSEFLSLTMSVKSQLRRAVRLSLEFENWNN